MAMIESRSVRAVAQIEDAIRARVRAERLLVTANNDDLRQEYDALIASSERALRAALAHIPAAQRLAALEMAEACAECCIARGHDAVARARQRYDAARRALIAALRVE